MPPDVLTRNTSINQELDYQFQWRKISKLDWVVPVNMKSAHVIGEVILLNRLQEKMLVNSIVEATSTI